MDQVQHVADKLYKTSYGRLVASLLHSFRDVDPETAEDIVQDSFSAALDDWRSKGIPDNPAGWIYTVCRNKALNRIKKQKRLEPISNVKAEKLLEPVFSESAFDDQQLKLLFACAHPDLSPKIQVAITLKYVANLKVEAIAKALGMTIDGIDKLLLRARQKIRDDKLLLEEPGISKLKQRLGSVHTVIYLIFNEGYKSSTGNELIQEDLCEDALMMNKILLDSGLGNKETIALYALMLFNSARLSSRFDLSGSLIDLENQDRSRWNHDLIRLGGDYLHQSRDENVSSYHLEASIAWLHCSAISFATTDWALICNLYARLLKQKPNPFVELNYAIALYYAGEKEQSFKKLLSLLRHPFMNQYYLLNTTLGKFYAAEGNAAIAKQFLFKALQQTDFVKEKEFIHKMISRL